MTNDELDKKGIETSNWITDHWKIILGIITILFIIFIISFASIKINNKIDSLINENEELKKAISETVNKYGKYCHYITYNILHNNEDSEECVNDA